MPPLQRLTLVGPIVGCDAGVVKAGEKRARYSPARRLERPEDVAAWDACLEEQRITVPAYVD